MIRYMLGESRTLQFEVTHQDAKEFFIASCEYEITKEGEIIESGQMEIDGHMMSLHFTPDSAGDYVLSFLYRVAGEKHGAKYRIAVV